MGRRAARDRAEPDCRLVRFETADGVALAGLLFEPKRVTGSAVIWLHGTGGSSVFESSRTNMLADAFIDRGVAFFPFNNRGSVIVRRAGATLGGSAFERIADCVADIDGAIRELWLRGYRDITLAGHSTGANKIAVYDHYKPRNRAKRYVLLAGGDDTGLLLTQLGARQFAALCANARRIARTRRGDEFVPGLTSLMTWRAFYDMANPDGDYNVFPFGEVLRRKRLSRKPLFRYVAAIRKPSLYIYGERDEYCYGDVPRCAEILAQHAGPGAEIVVVADADHGFSGQERELATLIAAWSATE
jgi:pimeloyl-ACP methyl ester carboxylesterase